ncbi:hypothetical protein JB92DRAFT_3104240 [Gautieria morchelliformis]|nr:hypothetical protein JB92DRAFT_3104240 [Gautieria morchelliformis]
MASDRRIRTAKSGCHWTSAELLDYSITILPCDVPTFFQIPSLPQIPIDSEFLTKKDRKDITDHLTRDLANLIYIASSSPEEAIVDLFACTFLSHLHYTSQTQYIGLHKELPLTMCEVETYAKPDIYLSDSFSSILMLLQEDKTVKNTSDVTPQLIAEAIGPFQHNNRLRRGAKLPHLNAKTVAATTAIPQTSEGSLAALTPLPSTAPLSPDTAEPSNVSGAHIVSGDVPIANSVTISIASSASPLGIYQDPEGHFPALSTPTTQPVGRMSGWNSPNLKKCEASEDAESAPLEKRRKLDDATWWELQDEGDAVARIVMDAMESLRTWRTKVEDAMRDGQISKGKIWAMWSSVNRSTRDTQGDSADIACVVPIAGAESYPQLHSSPIPEHTSTLPFQEEQNRMQLNVIGHIDIADRSMLYTKLRNRLAQAQHWLENHDITLTSAEWNHYVEDVPGNADALEEPGATDGEDVPGNVDAHEEPKATVSSPDNQAPQSPSPGASPAADQDEGEEEVDAPPARPPATRGWKKRKLPAKTVTIDPTNAGDDAVAPAEPPTTRGRPRTRRVPNLLDQSIPKTIPEYGYLENAILHGKDIYIHGSKAVRTKPCITCVKNTNVEKGQAAGKVAVAVPTASPAPISELPTPGPSILVRKAPAKGKKLNAPGSMQATPRAKGKKCANMDSTPPPGPANKHQKRTDKFAQLTAQGDARLLALQRATLNWQEWQTDMKEYLERSE